MLKWFTALVVIASNIYLLVGVFHNDWQMQTAMVWYAFEVLALSLFQFAKNLQRNWMHDSLGGIWMVVAAMVLSFFIIAFYSPRIQSERLAFTVNMEGLGNIASNLTPGIIAYIIYLLIIFILGIKTPNFNVSKTPLDPAYYLKKMLGAGVLVFLGIFIPFQKVSLILIVLFQTIYSLPIGVNQIKLLLLKLKAKYTNIAS